MTKVLVGIFIQSRVPRFPQYMSSYKIQVNMFLAFQVEFYRGQAVTPGDRYLAVMREFMAMASVRLAELEDLFTDTKARLGHEDEEKISE